MPHEKPSSLPPAVDSAFKAWAAIGPRGQASLHLDHGRAVEHAVKIHGEVLQLLSADAVTIALQQAYAAGKRGDPAPWTQEANAT